MAGLKLPLRPFASAHWLLPVTLVIGWELVLANLPCGEPPHYLAVALTTATAFIAFWVAHIRLAPIRSFLDVRRLLGMATADLVRLAVVVLLVALPLAILAGTNDCYTPGARSVQMLISTESIRGEISLRATHQGSLAGTGTGLAIPDLGAEIRTVILNDGTMVLARERPLMVLVFVPKLANGAVEWTCTGAPMHFMPITCLGR